MKPVFQTKVGPINGNCLAACIASLLEVGIDDVPDLSPRPDDKLGWIQNFRGFMKSRGVYPVIYSPGYFQPPAGVYYLIWGTSPRDLPHSVIGRNGKIVHDPNPAGGGVNPITEIVVFFPTFEDPNLVMCPRCEGFGHTLEFMIKVECFMCSGTGKVDKEWAEDYIVNGKQL